MASEMLVYTRKNGLGNVPIRVGRATALCIAKFAVAQKVVDFGEELIVRLAASKSAKNVAAGNRNYSMPNVDSAHLARLSDDGMAIRYWLPEPTKRLLVAMPPL